MSQEIIEENVNIPKDIQNSVRNTVCVYDIPISITTNDQCKVMGEDVKALTQEIKTIEAVNKKLRDPMKVAIDGINSFFKEPLTRLKNAKIARVSGIKAYVAEQDRIGAEAERKAKEAVRREKEREEARLLLRAERAEAKGNHEKADELIKKAETPSFVPTPSVAKQSPAVDGRFIRMTWKADIYNESLIPREFLIPDTKGLNAFARARKDKAVVPGVRFYAE